MEKFTWKIKIKPEFKSEFAEGMCGREFIAQKSILKPSSFIVSFEDRLVVIDPKICEVV